MAGENRDPAVYTDEGELVPAELFHYTSEADSAVF